MAAYEHDSDAYHWGFGFFNIDPFQNPPYSGGTTEQDSSIYNDCYIREDVSGCARENEEHMQASIFTQDLFGPCAREYSLVIQDEQEGDDTRPSSLCSSPGGKSYEGECSLDISDEYSLVDGEVGRRLNQMIPVPHIPRINGEIPSVDEATSDHQRLLDRLQLYDLIERKVQGDGNCQFRALSDQLYRTPEHHEFVRQQVVEQLKSHPKIYEGYVPMAYDDYLKKLSRSGEWGDHVTLQAASDSYGVKIFVITSFKDTCYIEILPNVEKSKRDLPNTDTKKKKKWWRFRNKH